MQVPELRNGRMQRKKLTKRFVLQGNCPNCDARLVLKDNEILQRMDQCPGCQKGFAIPGRLRDSLQATLAEEKEAAAARQREKQALLDAKALEQEEAAQAERLRAEKQAQVAAERRQRLLAAEARYSSMIVSTGDIHEPYDIIGPVYFSVSNKGLFFNALGDLVTKYQKKLQQMSHNETMTGISMDWGFMYGQLTVGQSQFDSAFFVSVEELKRRADRIGGDAIIFMRQDIDIDTTGMQYFYLQMYGTAVRLRKEG